MLMSIVSFVLGLFGMEIKKGGAQSDDQPSSDQKEADIPQKPDESSNDAATA